MFAYICVSRLCRVYLHMNSCVVLPTLPLMSWLEHLAQGFLLVGTLGYIRVQGGNNSSFEFNLNNLSIDTETLSLTHTRICTASIVKRYCEKIWNWFCPHRLACLCVWLPLPPPGGVHGGGGAAPPLLHGGLQLDAGGGPAALEQGGRREPQRGPTHEVLLPDWLG